MKVFLSCTEGMTLKLNKELIRLHIEVADAIEADYALVEKGFALPENLICICFDPLDYPQALELLAYSAQGTPTKSDEKWQDGHVITGTSADRFVLIQIETILYIEAFGNTVTCVTNTTTYNLKNPLYYYEEHLLNKGFLRVNKSQIINMIHVKEIIPWFNGRLVVVINDTLQLEVSKTYAKRLRRTLDL